VAGGLVGVKVAEGAGLVGVKVAGGTGVAGVEVAVEVAVGTGVVVGGVVLLQPGIALQTSRRPPVTVIPASPETGSTLFRIVLLSWSTVRPP
jgi:hypothetical protein